MTPWRIPPGKTGPRIAGDILLHYRRLMNLTQKQVAERAGLSKGFISNVETGRSGMTSVVWKRLARVLNIPDDISWGEKA